jgi:predicted CopG family antitoxin
MKKFWNKNKYIIVTILWFTLMFLIATNLPAQTVGTTKTESYKASFETKINIDSLMDYDGPQVPIQILTIGISDEVYEQYPELKEKKVGLGVANIVLEYLSDLNRFTFTEDKTEIKNRMVKQFQASQSVAASGLGEAKTVRELTLLNDDNLSDVKFNQSTIGITTKKALDIACGRILVRLIKKGKFPR